MMDIFSVDYRDAVRNIVRKEIKMKYGVKVPKPREKEKHKMMDDAQNKSKHFGVSLEKVPSENVRTDQYFPIPLFLVEAFGYLKEHLAVEGLFRKSGSANRQKVLREILERGGSFYECDSIHPHDVASLVKQFFRELPNPLFTNHLSSTFLKCLNLPNLIDSQNALLLCSLLLPDEHLRVLKYLVSYINEVANHSLESKMSIRNLGIVFAPNLLYITGKDRNCEKSMRETTQVIDYIFQNPDRIGMVPDYIIEKATTVSFDVGILTSSGDELDEAYKRGKIFEQHIGSEKNRDRTKSIRGFLRRGFRSADRHVGKISPKSWLKHDPIHKVSSSLDDTVAYHSSSSLSSSGSAKRQSSGELNCGPVRKSPRLEYNCDHVPDFSLGPMMCMPNQEKLTKNHKNLQYDMRISKVEDGSETPILPSKFGLTRAQNRGSPMPSRFHRLDSAMEVDQVELSRPQSKISRHTQKPHVKVSRRSSSLDRRRARYQSTTPKMRRRLPKTPMSDNAMKSPFQDENLTVSILFMKSYDIPKDVDAIEVNSLYSSRCSKLPRWKSDVTGSVEKRLTSDSERENLVRKHSRRGRTREKVKKSFSMVERSVSRVY